MSKCDLCKKRITQKDYGEEEAYLCAPRGFLGEGWHNWCWRRVHKDGNSFETLEQHSLCKKCRDRDGFTMVKVFSDLVIAKSWVQSMLTNM